jgi:trk system potassium uptake protein TrkA
MNILILGAGRVGESVAESLVSERNDITVDRHRPGQRLRALQDRLDLRGVVGNGIQPSVLRDAGIEDADMLIACAPLDETNLVACKVAHDVFNVPTASPASAPRVPEGSELLGRTALRWTR